MSDDLKLLVEWSSPWQEFVSAIRPAMAKSPEPLAGEAPTGLVPYRNMLLSWGVEAILLLAAIVLPARLASLRPTLPPPLPKYDVIYFSGDELPQTEDLGGAQTGRSGHAGGKQGHHRTQSIRVARAEPIRDTVVDAPKLNLPQSNSAVANLLAYKPVPGPAPAEGLKPSRQSPSLAATPVAPTPQINRDKMRQGPALAVQVIPPTPSGLQRDIFSVRIPGSQAVAVVPPPVSAPERITNLNAKLTLPPPSVIAPPPTQVVREIRPGPGFGAGELQKQVVPPPVQLGNASSADRRSSGGLGPANVVPPPVQLIGAANGRGAVASLGNPGAVPPPVQIGGGSLQMPSNGGLGGGTAVVPPPPTVSGSGSASGLGRGNRGAGLGGPLDAGAVTAPPSNTGGNTAGSGIVVSNQPGSKLGVPGAGGAGSLSLAPSGGPNPGIGGPGNGSGIAQGSGPGSGLSHDGSGSASAGPGHGADTVARFGTSPYPGSGGAGTGTVGKPPLPGVSVHGGTDVITLPSFGGADGVSVSAPGRSTRMKGQDGPSITIVGSSRSGGALNLYGSLKGDKVYTIYIDTALGTAVMEYADPTSALHPYADDLTAPQPVRADLPANLKPSRLVITCTLDRSGLLRNPRVLQRGGDEMTTRVLAALNSWKFRPVLRGTQPVEVTAILGFNIDTR